jgi:hypothetical protein
MSKPERRSALALRYPRLILGKVCESQGYYLVAWLGAPVGFGRHAPHSGYAESRVHMLEVGGTTSGASAEGNHSAGDLRQPADTHNKPRPKPCALL